MPIIEPKTPRKPRTKKPALTIDEMLFDPARVTISVSQAAQVLNISKSTAHNAYKRTGFLCSGVPVLCVGQRTVVSVKHLRHALGLPDPVAAV